MIDFGLSFYYCFQLVNVNGHICGSDRKVVYLSFDEAPEYERCVSHFNVGRGCGVHGVVGGSWARARAGQGERLTTRGTDCENGNEQKLRSFSIPFLEPHVLENPPVWLTTAHTVNSNGFSHSALKTFGLIRVDKSCIMSISRTIEEDLSMDVIGWEIVWMRCCKLRVMPLRKNGGAHILFCGCGRVLSCPDCANVHCSMGTRVTACDMV